MGPVLRARCRIGDYKQFGALRQPTTMKITSMSTQMTLTVSKVEYDNRRAVDVRAASPRSRR